MSGTLNSGFTVARPSAGPTVVAGSTTGLLGAGTYQYKVTFVSNFGETDGNTTATSTTTTTGSINLSAIPVAANTLYRRIYRTVSNGSSFLLLKQLNASDTTWVDIAADGTLSTAIPTANSASSRQIVEGAIKFSNAAALSVETGITAFATGGQTSARQLSAEVNVITVCATAADSVKLPQLTADNIGLHIVVVNNGIASANVFPALGQDASGGTNTAVAVAAAARAEFVSVSATAYVKTR